MAENNLQGILGVSMDKIREMVDVNTIVGEAIHTPDGVTLIPVSRVSYGFAAGGSNIPSKSQSELFGGGSGAGINITPVAFIVIHEGNVQVIPIVSKPDSGDKIVNLVPELFDKITALFRKKKDTTEKVEFTGGDDPSITVTETTTKS
ncbi:MAG TPA: GerW family sporulation protein [Candidatus Avimonas sp.]|jgi:sporulation protein YtfJ|nr:sporulation protein YtfJ [Clostridiales bacterium]HOB35906.1 GerW family sporulation protein [Candidatus Avimonas sp.]HQA15362.1 GerW family sporulation protein [Candidatus Avimonas sp.]HQD37322.1 GerW family sporulation protein [Candidatus Avimonas sp.]